MREREREREQVCVLCVCALVVCARETEPSCPSSQKLGTQIFCPQNVALSFIIPEEKKIKVPPGGVWLPGARSGRRRPPRRVTLFPGSGTVSSPAPIGRPETQSVPCPLSAGRRRGPTALCHPCRHVRARPRFGASSGSSESMASLARHGPRRRRRPARSCACPQNRRSKATRFGTGLPGPSAAGLRRPSGPRGGGPRAPASSPRASVAVAGTASWLVPGRWSRQTPMLTCHWPRQSSVPDTDSRAVGCPCGRRPSESLQASRQPQRLPVGVLGGGPGLCLYLALLRGRGRDAVGRSHVSFAGCCMHRVVATAPHHAMPTSESPARLRRLRVM